MIGWMMNEALLVAIAFFTSLLTAILGLGGGLILIALMPGLLPAPAIIPVHAVVQVASNLSRAVFAYRSIRWEFVFTFLLGALLGGILGAQVTLRINLDYVPLLIATFILFNAWGPQLEFRRSPRGEFLTIGFLQTALGMLVGAPGPIGQSVLVRKGVEHNAMVVTAAVFMTITHLIKILMFGLIGFSFVLYWKLCLGMIVSVILGSLAGNRLRRRTPKRNLQLAVRLLLTFLALRMIYITLM